MGLKQQKVTSEAPENTEKHQEESKDHPKFPTQKQALQRFPTQFYTPAFQPFSQPQSTNATSHPRVKGPGDSLTNRSKDAPAALAIWGLQSPGRPGPRAFAPARPSPASAPSLPQALGTTWALCSLRVPGEDDLPPGGPVLSEVPHL